MGIETTKTPPTRMTLASSSVVLRPKTGPFMSGNTHSARQLGGEDFEPILDFLVCSKEWDNGFDREI